MLFNSYTFAVFFVVLFALDRAIGHWPTRKGLLLLASYLFYAAWNPLYIFILGGSTGLDWWLARALDRAEGLRLRKALLILSLVANLGLLAFFKYWTLFMDGLAALLGIGQPHALPRHDLLLPVGISFYTFASLSYTIDVYRRKVRADASLPDYALFVSFFPHLVAGPIVRAYQFLPQLRAPRRATAAQVEWGLTLLILGLFSKAVMADFLFAPVVDTVFADPARFGTIEALAGVIAFSGQIYYDFAGYSLCAIGLALCFGFEFPDNFRYPYAAIGLRDFWRRWHISLSTWIRDYLYFPLGGSRSGPWRNGCNLLITMTLAGLWHGASPMFLLWGLLHGAYLAAERELTARCPIPATGLLPVLGMLLTVVLVTLTWIPFRAPDLATMFGILAALSAHDVTLKLDALTLLGVYLGFSATLVWQWRWREGSPELAFGHLRTIPRATLLGVCLLLIFLCSGGDERTFIYFQF